MCKYCLEKKIVSNKIDKGSTLTKIDRYGVTPVKKVYKK